MAPPRWTARGGARDLEATTAEAGSSPRLRVSPGVPPLVFTPTPVTHPWAGVAPGFGANCFGGPGQPVGGGTCVCSATPRPTQWCIHLSPPAPVQTGFGDRDTQWEGVQVCVAPLHGPTQQRPPVLVGPTSLRDHRGPHGMGAGASFALGPPRPPPRWCGGLHHVWIIESLVAWVRKPPPLWDHGGPSHISAGASFPLGPPRPAPRWRGGLLRIWIIAAPVTWDRGPPSLWNHPRPRRGGAGASCTFGSSSPLVHARGGFLRFVTTEAHTPTHTRTPTQPHTPHTRK